MTIYGCGLQVWWREKYKTSFQNQIYESIPQFIYSQFPSIARTEGISCSGFILAALVTTFLLYSKFSALYLAVKYVSLLLSLLFQMEYRFKRKSLRERIQFSR